MGKDVKIKERISYLRRGKKLSQEKMAQSLKISLNSYRKLETGPTRLVNRHVEQIASLLDVSCVSFPLLELLPTLHLDIIRTHRTE